MRLARPVYNQQGTLVIPVGTEVSEGHLRRLAETGFKEVFIDDPSVPDVAVQEAISETTKAAALEVLAELFNKAEAGQIKGDLGTLYDRVSQVVKDIQDDLGSQRGKLIDPRIEVNGHDYLAAHTLAVTVLTMAVARLGSFAPKVFDLGLGAMLHDLGMALVPRELRAKPEPLSSPERLIVHRHPQDGLKLVEQTPALSAFTKVIILQHHERAGGSGYPRALKDKDIYPLAKLTAIIDVYSALLAQRPFREAYSPQRAMDYIVSGAGFDFDFEMTHEFSLRVAPYPVGTIVTLSTGERGVVLSVKDGLVTRPVVRVFTDRAGKTTGGFADVNLSQPEHQTTMIADPGQS
jgi:HD-GYP domain-containing protein (c-di-GMP phosphodiesterase class II)